MVYTAMKLFMEINPSLFDDCSHEYTQLQETAPEREQKRKDKWLHLEEQARRGASTRAEPASSPYKGSGTKAGLTSVPPIDEDDALIDSTSRLQGLQLGSDESGRQYTDPGSRSHRSNSIKSGMAPR